MTNNQKWLEVTFRSVLEMGISNKAKLKILIEIAETYHAILEMEKQ